MFAKLLGEPNYNIENETASHRIAGKDGSLEKIGVSRGVVLERTAEQPPS